MKAITYWKAVVDDKSDFLDRFIALLEDHGIRYCLIGGQAVNAYVDPVVSLDLDVVIAVDQLAEVEALLAHTFSLERFPHRLNVSARDSGLRVQVQTDPRYLPFVERATTRTVRGRDLPVAAVDDLLAGKLWAFLDTSRRASKRLKDLTDIARLVETYLEFRHRLPPEIRAQIE